MNKVRITATLGIGLFALAVSATVPARADHADDIIAKWPAESGKAAKMIIEKYGQPDTESDTMLVWHNKGAFKRIVASRTSDVHRFPVKHPDSVEQTIAYRVPVNKIDDLARFDGSVTVDRTRGEMAARCDLEANNNLALNLANDIVMGKRTVAGARAYYGRAITRFKEKMVMDPYMKKLTFSTMRGMTADPDVSTIMPGMPKTGKM